MKQHVVLAATAEHACRVDLVKRPAFCAVSRSEALAGGKHLLLGLHPPGCPKMLRNMLQEGLALAQMADLMAV